MRRAAIGLLLAGVLTGCGGKPDPAAPLDPAAEQKYQEQLNKSRQAEGGKGSNPGGIPPAD
jgi:hypothetical protein